MKRQLLSLTEQFDYPAEAREALLSAWDSLMQSAEGQRAVEALHRDYLQAPETEGWIHRCEAVAALSPLPAYTTLQVLYLSLAPLLWEHYQKRGLSQF